MADINEALNESIEKVAAMEGGFTDNSGNQERKGA
jgi:hypothetical protein